MTTDQAQDQEKPAFTRENARMMGPYFVCENPPHYLSAVDFSDIPEMVRVLNIDKEVYNGTASFQYPYLESHAHARIARADGYIKTRGYNTHWAMRTSPKGPLMGWIHTHFDEDIHPRTGRTLKVGHIGYWVSPEHVGKGYASRSAQFLVNELMFKEFDCDIVRAEAYVYNRPSRKVLESTGMKCEVEERTVLIPKLQEQKIICCYAIHKDESTKSVVSKGHP
ncbi:hypothetical protein BGX28_007016 [Mortierella sp. GBA30]|nr:hypothetical protein BGX28_007016 [Mortierella sp. GBA30]